MTTMTIPAELSASPSNMKMEPIADMSTKPRCSLVQSEAFESFETILTTETQCTLLRIAELVPSIPETVAEESLQSEIPSILTTKEGVASAGMIAVGEWYAIGNVALSRSIPTLNRFYVDDVPATV